MTEPIRAAEVLAAACGHPAWCVNIEPRDCPGAKDGDHLVAALLALHPEGDVVIRRDGTVAGLEWAYYSSEGEMHRLVPLSREAE